MPRQFYHSRSSIFFVLLLAFLTGCATTVPDLKPFADGTAELRTATSASFSATANTLRHMASIMPDNFQKFTSHTLSSYLKQKPYVSRHSMPLSLIQTDSLKLLPLVNPKKSKPRQQQTLYRTSRALLLHSHPFQGVKTLLKYCLVRAKRRLNI